MRSKTNSLPRILVAVSMLAAVIQAAPAPVEAATFTLVPEGATWRYLDDGSNQGTAWRAPGFNDSAWASGPAQLGYGDSDEATVVSFGPDSNNKFVTTYFRHTFQVTDPGQFAGLTLRLLRDDGAVVYLNGTQIESNNMPGSFNFTTLSSTTISGSDEDAFASTSESTANLVAGTNVLAVEIHQRSLGSSDISFDLELLGTTGGANVTRGPYLQRGTDTSIVVRWRSDVATDSRVRYGTDVSNLNLFADDATSTTEHVVTVSGLSPDTRYFYSVGSTSEVQGGGDTTHTFLTAPVTGTARATRIWAMGDFGTADSNARAVRDGFETFTGTSGHDLLLMLGDNAYNSGTDAEYESAVFDTYPVQLRRAVTWATLGNHDEDSADSPTQSGVY